MAGRLQSRSSAGTVIPELVEGRVVRILSWFDRLITNGFSRTLQSSCVHGQGNRILNWSEKQAANFTPDRFEITDFDRV